MGKVVFTFAVRSQAYKIILNSLIGYIDGHEGSRVWSSQSEETGVQQMTRLILLSFAALALGGCDTVPWVILDAAKLVLIH